MLDSTEIEQIMSNLNIPYMILMRDQLKLDADKVPVGFPFILNLDTSDSTGTHWTCFMRVNTKTILYYDSFGRPPPQELISLCDRHNWACKYIDVQIQDDDSETCGYFAIWVIRELLKDKSSKRLNKRIKSVFSISGDLSANDETVVNQLSN